MRTKARIVVAAAVLIAFQVATLCVSASPAMADGPLATSTSLTANVNPAQYGQIVTLTATTTAVGSNGVPDGTIGFADTLTNRSLGFAVLDGNGHAQLAVSFTQVATHDVRAIYSGSASYVASISSLLHEGVGQGNSLLTLKASSNPSTVGAWITLSAAVKAAAPAIGAPTGYVTFINDGIELATVALSFGATSFVTTFIPGFRQISAVYSGDNGFLPSTATLVEVVGRATTTATVSTVSALVPVGTQPTLTATVASSLSPILGVPTGSVQFSEAGASLGGPAAVSNAGRAVAKLTLAPGIHQITATYLGDTNYKPSVATVTQWVGLPSAPAAPTVAAGAGSASVSWIAPADNGSPITGYVVTPFIGTVAQTPRTFSSTALSQVVTGLTNGSTYTFKVVAVNQYGSSVASPASIAVIVGAPKAPATPSAVAAVQGATVTWVAPAANAAAITGYVVTPYLGSVAQTPRVFSSTALSQAITGLTTAKSYTFTVQAINQYGRGLPSPKSAAIVVR